MVVLYDRQSDSTRCVWKAKAHSQHKQTSTWTDFRPTIGLTHLNIPSRQFSVQTPTLLANGTNQNTIKHHLACHDVHRLPLLYSFYLSALHLMTQQRLRALPRPNKVRQKGLAIWLLYSFLFHFAGHHAANTNRFRLQGGSCTSERIWPETL